ncbi:MAG: hypothetical protein V4436_03325 [Patescibacteria group bacterium]
MKTLLIGVFVMAALLGVTYIPNPWFSHDSLNMGIMTVFYQREFLLMAVIIGLLYPLTQRWSKGWKWWVAVAVTSIGILLTMQAWLKILAVGDPALSGYIAFLLTMGEFSLGYFLSKLNKQADATT